MTQPDETVAQDDLMTLCHQHCTHCGRPGRPHETRVGVWHCELGATSMAVAYTWCTRCRLQPEADARMDATLRLKYALPAQE